MDLLNIPVKKEGDELTHQEWNLSVDKINEMVAALNGASSVQRKIFIQNNMDSKSIAAQKGQPCILDFTFVSQERYSYDNPFENTGERGLCEISIKNTNNENYTVVKQLYINSNVSIKLDVAEFLASGANSLMIKAVGKLTGEVTPAYAYTIQLTSLSISATNFKWWTTFYNEIVIPFQIGGNINKTLYVEVTSADGFYNEAYSVNLGTSIYTETAYNYTIPHPNQAGVFHIKTYLTNSDGTIRTQAVEFNIMCSMSLDISAFIAINNVATEVTNWTENALFDYSLSDAGAATTAVTFKIKKDGKQVFQSVESSVSTNTKHTFIYPMEIETDTNENFEISVEVTNVNGALTEPLTFAVNNSLGFSATAGASFYMNPRTRSNAQANKEKIINEVDGSEVDAVWRKMNWNNDGWTVDADGNKVLLIMAGGLLDIAEQPFAVESARKGKTIEFDYKPDCVTDFNHPVLKISTPAGEKFIGLQIYPDDVVMYSSALKDKDNQSINVYEEKRTRITVVIMPDAYGNPGFNLCIIYVNGRKNREFTYENNDYFAQNGTISIGSDYADTYTYGARVYDFALTSGGVLRNLINWLPTKEEKEAVQEKNDVLDENGSKIDFYKVKEKYNTFVIKEPIPSLFNPNVLTTSWHTYFAEHPEWNWWIDIIDVDGQGTSSKKYWRWNLRGKDGKQSVATYADGSTTVGYVNLTPALKKVKKLTAKKNVASSMHSHKMGSVNSIDDLAREMGIIEADSPRIATYQMPFVGFSMSVNEEGEEVYTFIGLYTFGPDKGDAATFGYDTDKYPELLSIEGSDNAPLFSLFRVPWDPNKNYIAYNPNEEAMQYNNTNSWDYDAGKPDSEKEPEAVFALNKKLWMPSYNFVYECSPRLQPFIGDAAALNSRISELRSSGTDYWITGGDVYYYEPAEGLFIPATTHNGTINLYTQLVDKGYGLTSDDLSGKTVSELNELFINARVQKFRQEAQSVGHYNIADAIFHWCWVEFNAATDNLTKNTYPYIFGDPNSAISYLWRWRFDDLDTIWSIINQGLSKKGYGVEFGDKYENGGAIWNGETSNFWALIRMAFPEEIKESMKNMMKAMEKLGGLTTGSSFDKIYAFFDKYYFKQAQEYFCENLYNADAQWTYEEAKLAYMAGQYTNDTDPITQSMGDLYAAEQRWIRKRILYMMSKYSYGVFSADGTDTIVVRAAGDKITYELTPAMDMYPAVANGTSIIRGARTKAGEKCVIEVELGGTGDQQNAIQAASYMQDIGDWHDKNVTGAMIIKGRMLRKIKLGDAVKDIVISITGLTLSDCISLQELDLQRISTLAGVLNLAACSHLMKLFAGGTSIVQIVLPEGGALDYVEYPATNIYLLLKNFPVLTAEGLIIDQCAENITDYMIQECPNLNSMEILVQIMMAQKDQAEHHLKRVRAVGFVANFTDNGTEVLDFLANLSDGSYEGLNSEGIAGDETKPVLDGTINVKANVYEDSVNLLKAYFDRLTLNVIGEFYVRFQDSEVFKLVMDNWFANRKGVTKTDLSTITNFGQVFKNNTSIKYFNEAQYTRLTNLDSNSVFEGCVNLKEMTLPSTLTTMRLNGVFNYCVMDKLEILNGDGSKGLTLGGEAIATGITLKRFILPERTILLNNYWARGNAIDEIYLYAKIPPTLNIAYGDNLSDKVLYVPYESLSAYEIATNYSNFAKIRPIPVDRLDAISIVYKTSVLEVVYTPYYTSLREVTWEIISGNEFATIDAATGELTVLENADNSPVTVKATSNYNSLLTATLDINVTYAPFPIPIYEIPEEFIGNGNSNYIDTGLTWDDLNDTDYTIIVNASLGTYSSMATIFSLLREASPYPGVSFGSSNNASRARFVYGWSGASFEFPYSDGTYILVKFGSTFKMYSYLDSTLSLLKEYTGTYSPTSYPSKLIVGAAEDGSYSKFRYWNGRISRFEVYNKALNEEDIHNCIAAPLLSMDIEYNNSKCTINYHPRYTNEKGVVWEIAEGSEYAMITSNGLVIPLVGANNNEVTVKATSTYHPSITATKKITVTYVETGGLNGAIQSTGNRYIKTDIYFPNLSNTKVEAKFAFLSTPVVGMVFGCRTSPSASNGVGAYFNSTTKCNFMLGGRKSGDIDITLNSDYNIMSIDSNGISLNGKSLNFSNPTAEITNNIVFPLWIFANNNGGGIHGLLTNTTKLWYVKIWEDGELVHNLVPNIDADGIVGLRDTETGMVYNPTGTLTYIED